MGVKFDNTIGLGHILTVVSMLIGGAVAYANLQVDITEVKVKLQALELGTGDRFTGTNARDLEARWDRRFAQIVTGLQAVDTRVRDLERHTHGSTQ